jgi:transglutaminase-like putative cysteine protease
VGEALFDINKKIEYKSDTDTYNATDYFCFPWETLLTKTGDCEDKSYLLASLLQACDVQNVSVVFGKVNLESRSYGHCWVKAEGKTIETTVDKYTPLPSTPEFYAPEVEIGWAWATQIAYPIEGWDIATTGIESFGASLKKVGKEEIEKLKEELEKYKPEEEKHIGGITLW